MEEEFSGTESNNTVDTVEFSQDEFDNVAVEAVEVEASGWSYENEDESLEPYTDEALHMKNGLHVTKRNKKIKS